jgi:hypothetical protein
MMKAETSETIDKTPFRHGWSTKTTLQNTVQQKNFAAPRYSGNFSTSGAMQEAFTDTTGVLGRTDHFSYEHEILLIYQCLLYAVPSCTVT